MNVNDIAYMYKSALGNTSSVTASGSVSSAMATEAPKKAGADSFSASLNEEVSKLTDEERAKAIEFRELAGALDRTVLGSMIDGATDKDLALMSEEMLGSSKGREVLSKLMEGQFTSMVLSGSDDDDDSSTKSFEAASDSFSDTVTKAQEIIDKLESVADTIQPTEGEEK